MNAVNPETVVIRFFITPELNDVLSDAYAKEYKGRNSEGVKADLYKRFDVAPPKPPTALDKKRERLAKLAAEIEALEAAQTQESKSEAPVNASSDDTAKQDTTPAPQNGTAKPSTGQPEGGSAGQGAQKPTAAKPATPAKGSPAQKK